MDFLFTPSPKMELPSFKRNYVEQSSLKRKYDAEHIRETLYENAHPLKKSKNYELGGCFEEGYFQEEIFHIGNHTYVYSKVFNGEVVVHIRRFQKHGETLYPTRDGVTLPGFWIQRHLKENPPRNSVDMERLNEQGFEEVFFESDDFETFRINRMRAMKSGDISRRCVPLSVSQWLSLSEQRHRITASVWEKIYSTINIMDYSDCFSSFPNIGKALPNMMDGIAGRLSLLNILRDELIGLVKEKGLKEPAYFTEGELTANHLETFNNAISELDVESLIVYFSQSQSLNTIRDYLCLKKPSKYVTVPFLKSICFGSILREVRYFFCPPLYTDDYFENVTV